ncbi:hypothetical protein HX004_00200 [Myroides sp. 1354]|uniref:hypothetical protein n=1 Tax=unclassified Myroides TaxID=2642485 RepID=UPI0025776016|nr:MULTISPECIES: hypothetical protein [unclassified Myroides]MDM1043743.1 hypothetical protein [Myroides sp. R163-1]MDM1054207.1 hypothetical protein [Myroides sp. 1354]MDM1067503.1 hypothetical protein [Myroides sp. 1372]
MRKVTLEEIEQLHLFVRKHYVEFYDVEMELVDHLANDIEIQWQEDQQLSFDVALNRAFKKFGIFGFSDVVEQKVNELSTSYYKKSFRLLLHCFTIPKIVVSTALFLVLYVFFRYLSNAYALYANEVIKGILMGLIVIQFIQLMRRRIRYKKENRRQWLLHAVLFNLEIWPYYLMFIFLFQSFLLARTTTFLLVLQAFVVTLSILYVYVLKAIVVPQIERDLEQQKRQLLFVG